jgi:hypothetical protein
MFINEGVVSAAIEERNLVVDVLQPKLRRVID